MHLPANLEVVIVVVVVKVVFVYINMNIDSRITHFVLAGPICRLCQPGFASRVLPAGI